MDVLGRGGAAIGAVFCVVFGVLVSPIVHPSFSPDVSGAPSKWQVEFDEGHISVVARHGLGGPKTMFDDETSSVTSALHDASEVLGPALDRNGNPQKAPRPTVGTQAAAPGTQLNGSNTDEACFIRRVKEAIPTKEDVISWNGQNLIAFDTMFDLYNVYSLFALPGENTSSEEGRAAIIKAIKAKDHKELERRRWSDGRSKADLQGLRERKLIFGGGVKALHQIGVCHMSILHRHIGVPYVLFFGFNENWGGLSTELPCESTKWGPLFSHQKRDGCSMQHLMQYVDEPGVLGIITAQHQHPLLTRSGKTWSIPLGTRHPEYAWPTIENPPALPGGTKPRTMFMSLSDWEFRKKISEAVTGNSDGQIKKDGSFAREEFFGQMYKSKYVLCVAGMGWDTYRGWETLMSGSIPVLRRSTGVGGLLHSYGYSPDGNHKLPVLWVDDWQEVHPQMLEDRYQSIVSRCNEYDFGRLRKSWWKDMVMGLFDKAPAP